MLAHMWIVTIFQKAAYRVNMVVRIEGPKWRGAHSNGHCLSNSLKMKLFEKIHRYVILFLFSVRRVPPHFSIPPESVEVMPGGSANLTCVAVGSPMPKIKWRLGAVELTNEDDIPTGKNILMLSNIQETTTYTCVATSELGNIEYDVEVRVKGERLRLWFCALFSVLWMFC